MTRNDSIRKEILMQLYASRPLARNASFVQRESAKAGYDYGLREIQSELQFLAGEKLIEQHDLPGVTEPQWLITSAGVRQFEQTLAL